MDSQFDGVKFYSKSDLSIGYNLEKAEKLINAFDETNTEYTVNSILEMYNICLLFDSEARLKSWSEEYYSKLTLVVDRFRCIIGKFCSNIDYTYFETFYPELSILYQDSFWDLFECNKIYENISPEEFRSLIKKYRFPLYIILKHKFIVKHYDNEISDYMRQTESTAEILISQYLESKESKHKGYYIPETLKPNQRIEIIGNYIDKDDANPNYLFLLSKSRKTKEFPISDNIRLKSKRRYETYVEKWFESGTGYSVKVAVGYSDSNEEIEFSCEDKSNLKITYSRLWLQENTDNPTLLNNFIYLFEYVDRCFRSTFPSNEKYFGSLERLLRIKGNREYEVGMLFKIKEMISSMQIKSYYFELLKLDKRLEEIFK